MIKQRSFRKICYGGVFILIIISGMYFITEFTGQIGYVDASINSYAWLYHNKNTSSGIDRVYIPEKANINRDTKKNKILLISYMRSGSTFTSEVLNQGGRVFFSFEPFWGVYRKMYRTNDKVCHRDGSCREPIEQNQRLDKTIGILENIYKCKLLDIPVEVLSSFWMFPQSSGHTRINRCYTPKTPLSNTKMHRFRKDMLKKRKCVRMLERLCESSQVILIKTIRLSMKLLPEILANILDLKIVHLVRDPRAILHSREGVSDITYFQIRAHARGLCNRIKDDMESGLLQNVFRLKYECLIFDTINTVKQLFTDLKLIHTNGVDNWLKRHTRANYTTFGHKFGVHRANSLEISSKWFGGIPEGVLKIINEECSLTYQRLGLVTKDENFKTPTSRSQITNMYASMCLKQ